MARLARFALVLATLGTTGCALNPIVNPYPGTGMMMTDGPRPAKEKALRNAVEQRKE